MIGKFSLIGSEKNRIGKIGRVRGLYLKTPGNSVAAGEALRGGNVERARSLLEAHIPAAPRNLIYAISSSAGIGRKCNLEGLRGNSSLAPSLERAC